MRTLNRQKSVRFNFDRALNARIVSVKLFMRTKFSIMSLYFVAQGSRQPVGNIDVGWIGQYKF